MVATVTSLPITKDLTFFWGVFIRSKDLRKPFPLVTKSVLIPSAFLMWAQVLPGYCCRSVNKHI